MPRRANTQIFILDAVFSVLSLGALGYFIWLADLYSACLSLILLSIAARHLLNDWQSLQITEVQLSLRTTRRSWHVDTLIFCLLTLAALNSLLRGDPLVLPLLTIAGAILTARHWLNGYYSLHKPRASFPSTPTGFGELATQTITGKSQ